MCDRITKRYYCPMRPPAPGAIPNDGLVSIQSNNYRTYDANAGREVWGYVEYNRLLSRKEIRNYELIPAPDNTL